ncbi:chitin-binding type-2 domain-containing protein [Trichonephila clavata]|uniref:Chitin-binding type-2 domain-containing protein n=1 Tax=Trichonephila clavata TaxID=2740835 RepID=A0A8X6LKA8_TRICU|nr:chitin-binding type-2 domain-containing protein [Trichonephila clavata]
MIAPRKILLWIATCTFFLQHVCRAKQIRGIPEVDYPTYYVIPKTSFRCSDQLYNPGFYADIETRCQVFHYCYEHRQESFLCPLGTIFNQPILSCDYWYSSDCSKAVEYYHVNMNQVQEDDTDLGTINPLENQSSSSNVFDKMKHLYEETKTSDTSIPLDDFNNFKKKPSDKLEDLTEEFLGESRIQDYYKNNENNGDLNITPDMLLEMGDEKHPELVRIKIKNSNELNVYEGYESEDYDENEAGEDLVFYDDGMLHIKNSALSRSDTLEKMKPSEHDTNADTEAKSFDNLESKIQESTDSELYKKISEKNGNLITKRPPRRRPVYVIKEYEGKPVELPVQIVKPKRRPIKIGMDSTVQPSMFSESTDSSNIADESTTASAKVFDPNISSSGILGDDSDIDSEQDFALFNELNEKLGDKVLDETLMPGFNQNENIEERKNDNETTDDEYHEDFSGEEDTEIGNMLSNFEENEASSHMGSGDDFDDIESISVFETENPVFFEETDYLTNFRGTSDIIDETNTKNLAADDFLDNTESTNENEYGSAEDIDMVLSTESAEEGPNFVNDYNELGDYIYLTPDELQQLQKNSFQETSAIPDQVAEADREAETFYYYLPDSESESDYPFDHSIGIYPEGMNYNINENLEAEINDDLVDMESIEEQVDSNETLIDVPTHEELEDRRAETSEEQIEEDLSETTAIKSNMGLNHNCKDSQSFCLKDSKDTPENLSDNFPDSNAGISEMFPQTSSTKNPRRKYQVIYEEDKYENLTPEDITFLEMMAETSAPYPEVPAETSHQVIDDGNPDSTALEESEVLQTEIPFNHKNTEKEPIKFNEIDHTEFVNSLDTGKHKVEVFEHGSKIPETELNIEKEKGLNIKDSDQFVFPEQETLISPELVKNEKISTKDSGSAILANSKSKNLNEIPFENIGYKQNLPTKPLKSTQKNPVKIPVSKQGVQKLTKNELNRKPRAMDLHFPINFNPVSAPDLGIVAQKMSYIPTTFLKFKHSTLKPYFSESYYDRDFESSEFFARSGYISEPSKLSKVMEFGKRLLRAKRAKLKIIRKFAERFGRNFYDVSS